MLLRKKRQAKRLGEHVKQALYTSPPFDVLKVFPEQFVVSFALLVYVTFIVIYVYFFVVSYQNRLSERYVSVEASVGDCEEVSTAVDATFLATASGHWQGQSGFQFSDAVYEYTFSDLEVTSAEFRDLIEKDFGLAALGRSMEQRPVGENLLVWMNYLKQKSINGFRQQFQLASAPSDVFDKRYLDGWALNASSLCSSTFMSFDPSNGRLQFEFPRTEECARYLAPIVLPKQTSSALLASINANTLTTAMAVNRGILSLDVLEHVSFFTGFEYQGYKLRVDTYYDPRWKHSFPVYCIGAAEKEEEEEVRRQFPWVPLCYDEGQNTPMLPQFYHYHSECLQCDAVDDHSESTEVNCNFLDLVAGYLYVLDDGATYEEKLIRLLDLIESTASTAELDNLISGSIVRRESDELFVRCPTCAAVVANLWDDVSPVTPYFYKLDRPHCYDSVTVVDTAALARNEPTALVEKYYNCRDYPLEAFWYATALAFGDTGTVTPLVLLVLLPLMYLYVRLMGYNLKRDEYSVMAQEEVMGDIAMELLRIKNGDYIGIEDMAIVEALASRKLSKSQTLAAPSSATTDGKAPPTPLTRANVLSSSVTRSARSDLQRSPDRFMSAQSSAMDLGGDAHSRMEEGNAVDVRRKEENALYRLALALELARERRELAAVARRTLKEELRRSPGGSGKVDRAQSLKMVRRSLGSQRSPHSPRSSLGQAPPSSVSGADETFRGEASAGQGSMGANANTGQQLAARLLLDLDEPSFHFMYRDPDSRSASLTHDSLGDLSPSEKSHFED